MRTKTLLAGPSRNPVAHLAALVGAWAVAWLCWLGRSHDIGLTQSSEWRESVIGVASSLSGVPWLVVTASALAAGLAGLHYLLAGVALRASCGRPLSLREAAFSQVAASVLNRVLPAGLGGTAVNVRYLTRRGLPRGSALMAMGALGLLGALANVVIAGLLIFTGGWLGLGGGQTELRQLAATGVQAFPGRHVPPAVPAMAATLALGALALAIYRVARRRRRLGIAAAPGSGQAWRHLVDLVTQPGRAVTVILASSGTTLVMALGFALVVSAVTTGGAVPSPAALMIAYLVGTGTASASHVPAIAGPAELALIGVLVGSGVPGGQAALSVLLFRGLTYWTPVPVGLFALRWLRNRGAL
jgi:uncharacterized membrane protein YbhN (UPF0104 family)